MEKNVNEILNYLKKNCMSEAEAISGNKLGKLFNTEPRQLRNKINYLRCNGHPVCSSTKGYWYSRDQTDIDTTIEHLQSWIKGLSKAVYALKRIDLSKC